jgi:hypothetical protein
MNTDKRRISNALIKVALLNLMTKFYDAGIAKIPVG